LWSRRGALAGLLALGGCGFRPLHGPVESSDAAGTADIAQELAAVRVGYMADRFGVLVRRGLQRKLESEAGGAQARYTLNVSVGLSGEALGYRRDGTISRVRYTANCNWNLQTLSVPPRSIARSTIPVRLIDAFNVPDLQFFSADTSRDAMEGRIAEAVGDEVYREVAIALRKYIADGRPGADPVGGAAPVAAPARSG
jgi:LPS-assembly lipoprotein